MSAEPVLIVEDDDSLRLIVQTQLEKLGYVTALAINAEQALEILKQSHPRLVITDLQLPGMSGIELLKRIQVDFPGLPVIVVTAFGTVQSAVNAMKAGAYDYITKPVHGYELSALVRCALHRQGGELGHAPEGNYGFDQIIGSSTS